MDRSSLDGVFPLTELEDRGGWSIMWVRLIIAHTLLFWLIVGPFVLFPALWTREDRYCVAQNTTGFIDLHADNCVVSIVAQTRDFSVQQDDLFGSSARANRLEIVVSTSGDYATVADSLRQVWPRFANRWRSLTGSPEVWTGGSCSSAGKNGSVTISAAQGANPYIPCAIVWLPQGAHARLAAVGGTECARKS